MDEQRRSNTLFVGGLPANITNEEMENVFGEIGPLKRCFAVSGKGIGYVTFAFKEDADLAVSRIKTLNGKKLNIKVANKKISKKEAKKKAENADQASSSGGGLFASPVNVNKVKDTAKHQSTGKKQEGRLILRNLSFKAEKDHIHKEFGKFGKILEVSIPIKSDGKKLGFGFVQYEKYEDAVKAINSLNAKAFMGRPIAVDHAIPQSEYLQIKGESSAQTNIEDHEDVEVKCSATITKKSDNATLETFEKPSSSTNNDDNENDWMESGGSEDEDELNSDEECSDREDDDEDEHENDDDEDEEREEEAPSERPEKKRKQKKSDVDEGKTLFIRNLNFITTTPKLKEVFSQFGNLEYATICVDRLTEHSKGSGFVKFKKKEDAERCLQLIAESPTDGGIIIDDFKINVSSAISKNDMKKSKQQESLDKMKSNRNLYLAREGMIRSGTKAAEGASQTDLIKRTEVEVWKRQMLKNLHIFISKTRLCVRNLPGNVDDFKLKKIFLKAAGQKASITECKVMRHLATSGPDGYPLSKGYGFINFTQHEHALNALRQINNNPDIFTSVKRPIVEFSLENKSALRAKQKRLEKSTMKKNIKDKTTASNLPSNSIDEFEETTEYNHSFTGTKSEEMRFKKGLPSHVGPKIRHGRKISRNLLKKQKKLQKRSRKTVLAEKMKKMNYTPAKIKTDRMDKFELERRQPTKTGRKNVKRSKWHSR